MSKNDTFYLLFSYLKSCFHASVSFIIAITDATVHTMIAAPYAYLSTVWSGSENSLWPHLALVPASALAGIAVGFGIVLERPKYTARVHRVAFWLVVGGVVFEFVCTISLFVVDERISAAQQSTIVRLESQNIDLERMLLPRRWYGPLAGSMRGAPTAASLWADMDIESKLYSFSGMILAKVQYAAKDDEAARLAAQIKYGLSVARWNLSDLASEQSRITYVGDGVQLWTSPEHGDAFNAAEALEQSLKLEGIQAEAPDRPLHRYDPKGLPDGDIRKSLSPDTIIILVGAKPGYLDLLGKEANAYKEAHPGEK